MAYQNAENAKSRAARALSLAQGAYARAAATASALTGDAQAAAAAAAEAESHYEKLKDEYDKQQQAKNKPKKHPGPGPCSTTCVQPRPQPQPIRPPAPGSSTPNPSPPSQSPAPPGESPSPNPAGAGQGSGNGGIGQPPASSCSDEGGGSTAEDTNAGVRAFAHGTSPESAADIAENGLSEAAARAESAGGRFATRGSFHTAEINPASPGEALDTAMSYGFLKSPTPNVVVSELPEGVFQDMLSRGLASIEKVPGLGEQVVFHPGSYGIFNECSDRYVINPYG